MPSLLYILLFSIAAVVLSVSVGYIYGRQRSKDERTATMNVLLVVLAKTEELTNDVDSRNAELENVGRSVEKLKVTGKMADVQQALLSQIATVIQSNKTLADDLICANYSLEEQAQELDRTRRLARTDTLSGVANRMSFDETLSFWLSSSNRQTTNFTLVLADVDRFKWINDTHGHVAGDCVITHIGRVLRERVRSSDYAARIGGDEFAFLLAQDNSEMTAEIAERIRASVSARNFKVGLKNERVALTISMGVTISREGDSPNTMLERADRALYRSKQAGRNCLRWGQQEPVEAEAGA